VTVVGAGVSVTFRLATRPEVRIVLSNLGLACCSLEIDAAVQRGLLLPDTDPDGILAPPDLTVLLLAGTITEALGPAVVRAYEELAGPVSVLAYGACASTAGPYWDAPTVVKGADLLVPVSCYVPGCPPRPEALVEALLALAPHEAP
jgi:NADH:ubiquinone oxidoreductase subunit B-like Fe-S oxidoreductase